jgi:hypothetical protein
MGRVTQLAAVSVLGIAIGFYTFNEPLKVRAGVVCDRAAAAAGDPVAVATWRWQRHTCPSASQTMCSPTCTAQEAAAKQRERAAQQEAAERPWRQCQQQSVAAPVREDGSAPGAQQQQQPDRG